MGKTTFSLEEAALRYHREPVPGKLAIRATKPLANQLDLSLAYSPGVGAASRAIAEDPDSVVDYTIRGNLVAVVTNGTAVLGLGDIGPLAAKPVMEGKAVLFKKFANINCFDIEVDARSVDEFVEVVARLEPSFGGINLEDIKAPECFEIERRLRERMRIPVFHDDQHGTAIVVAAAVLNALAVVNKRIEDVRLVTVGAGAASIACTDLLIKMGLDPEKVLMLDRAGVIHTGRSDLNPYKARFARETDRRSLEEALEGADIFLGLSGPGVLRKEWVARMADRPIILALANPTPEILPEEALAVRPDAIIATGRSDYPNQVNNVLCFPFLFRGALDVGATEINDAMKIAAARAIAGLARKEASDIVVRAYQAGEGLKLGPRYLIPKPFDPRLITEVAPAVAKAAMDTGVARRPIADFDAYRRKLEAIVFRSGTLMQPIFDAARRHRKRLIFAEGEDPRVLQAAQIMVDDGLAEITLVGRPEVVAMRIERAGLRLQPGKDVALINPQSDARYKEYWTLYHSLMERKGVSPGEARTVVRTNNTVIAALAVRRGEADAMVAGPVGRYHTHLRPILDVIGLESGARVAAAMSILLLRRGTFFLCDTYINPDPSAEEIAEIAMMAAREVRRFGLKPKVALLSHSNFGSADTPSARKMREALRILHHRAPDLEAEGEMHGDAALDETIRQQVFPNSRLKGAANLLVMPNLDAANIAYELLKVLGDGQPVGPLLVGTAKPAHIVTPSVTARGILNVAAIAAVDAAEQMELALAGRGN